MLEACATRAPLVGWGLEAQAWGCGYPRGEVRLSARPSVTVPAGRAGREAASTRTGGAGERPAARGGLGPRCDWPPAKASRPAWADMTASDEDLEADLFEEDWFPAVLPSVPPWPNFDGFAVVEGEVEEKQTQAVEVKGVDERAAEFPLLKLLAVGGSAAACVASCLGIGSSASLSATARAALSVRYVSHHRDRRKQRFENFPSLPPRTRTKGTT